MNKKQKFEYVAKAMTQSEREDGTEFYHFTDEAPEEFVDLFLSHYEVRDLDYEIWNDACIWISERDYKAFIKDDFEYNDMSFASVYNADRLAYLNVWNEDEIADYTKQGYGNISVACAYWYDNQVENAIYFIRN